MSFPLCKIPKIRLDFSPGPPPPCQKFPWEIVDFALTPFPLVWKFVQVYLVINYDGFPKQ